MIRHVSVSIEYLLEMTDEKLSVMFDCIGSEIRSELLDRKAQGEIKLGVLGCDGFDPVKGCPGH